MHAEPVLQADTRAQLRLTKGCMVQSFIFACASERNAEHRKRMIEILTTRTQGPIMKTKLVIGIVAVSAIFSCIAANAQDSDREHPMHFITDSAITVKIKAKLADAKIDTLTHIRVDTDDHGVVVLSGHARDRAQEDMAVSIARRTEGVANVLDHIKIHSD